MSVSVEIDGEDSANGLKKEFMFNITHCRSLRALFVDERHIGLPSK